jgi:MFS family permease
MIPALNQGPKLIVATTPKQMQPTPSPLAWNNRNLRLYFGGQIISMIGTWMQQMALTWLVYRLTNSLTMLGLMAFATQAPAFFITPFAGIVTDRVQKHRLVVTTQCFAMLQAGILALLVLTGHPQIWQLMVLGAFSGVINAFDLPSRQTFLVEMLDDRSLLPNAIATNSSIVTITRLIGPTLAGVFIAKAGEGMCFAINALSYVAVIGALLFIRTNPPAREKTHKSVTEELKEGFKYAFGFRPLRSLILLMALVSLVGMPFATLLPAFAKDVFHGDASTLGFLTAASGVGALVGALFLASRRGVLGLGRWLVIACAVFGIGLTCFGLSHSLYVAMFFLVFVGFGSMVQMASCNTLIQTIVEEDKRGRVMSIYTMAFVGLAPFGSLVAGGLASKIGASETVLISGILSILLAVGFASRLRLIRQDVRPIYVERGILTAERELKVMNS